MIRVFRSPDRRWKTEPFEIGKSRDYCLAEKTRNGSLITRFSLSGMVNDQVYYKNVEPETALGNYIGAELSVEYVSNYERVSVSTPCKKCGEEKIAREMDLADPYLIENVQVVPLFRCLSCGERFYSMSKEYLSSLVERNVGLFETDEIEEKKKDPALFVNTLNEYIIRIFASKKITRLSVKE